MVTHRNPGPIAFDAVIEKPDGPGAYVTFPFSSVFSVTSVRKMPLIHGVSPYKHGRSRC